MCKIIVLCCYCVLLDSCGGMMAERDLGKEADLPDIVECRKLNFYVVAGGTTGYLDWFWSLLGLNTPATLNEDKWLWGFNMVSAALVETWGIGADQLVLSGDDRTLGRGPTASMKNVLDRPMEYSSLVEIAMDLTQKLDKLGPFGTSASTVCFCIPEKESTVRNKNGQTIGDPGDLWQITIE
ncbi:MAG: hypothetical protein LBF54_00995 [Holosporaceae bacterium]|nr:hypothetical protein [Holosporaceae bacterium]